MPPAIAPPATAVPFATTTLFVVLIGVRLIVQPVLPSLPLAALSRLVAYKAGFEFWSE